ncbi:MAG: O-antigen ligase family protein, partial [Bacteroidota bacterium]
PGGFGTDLPSEPVMVSLMFIYLFYVLYRVKQLNAAFLKHPISILLLLHLAWTFASSITAEIIYIALKFSFARVWYITVFYFLAGSLLKTVDDFRKAFWWVLVPLVSTVIIVLIRYAGYGFAFEEVNSVLNPFYRNHITYASILVLFYPFVWFARDWYPRGSKVRYGLWLVLLLLLVGIQFAYARLAYLALLGAVGAYFIFRLRLGKWAIAFSLVLALLGVRAALYQNTFLEFAPDFEKTVTHYEFDNLVEATFKLEDISSMERVYRWVAAIYMVAEKPWMGVGPGNFYESYWGHTLNKFETYISNNIEKSGIHCYYLMVLVEQGLVGLLIFLLFAFYPLIRGERIYHQTKDPLYKNLVMAMLLCLI